VAHVVERRADELAPDVVRREQVHAAARVAERAGGRVRDVQRLAALAAPAEDRLLGAGEPDRLQLRDADVAVEQEEGLHGEPREAGHYREQRDGPQHDRAP
jgi:hypothetical protein